MANATSKPTRDLLEPEIPHLRRFARYLTRNPEYADDLVQDCLMRALKSIDSWQPGTNLRTWLFVILKNQFRNDLRKQKRERYGVAQMEHQVIPATDQETQTRDSMIAVKRAFSELSQEHREILTLVAVEGLEYEEAANVLDIAVGTVRSRLARARRRLRETVAGTETHDAAQQPPRVPDETPT